MGRVIFEKTCVPVLMISTIVRERPLTTNKWPLFGLITKSSGSSRQRLGQELPALMARTTGVVHDPRSYTTPRGTNLSWPVSEGNLAVHAQGRLFSPGAAPSRAGAAPD